MKFSIKLIPIVVAFAASMLFSSCFKRGADDPFISLHTRDGRFTQNWILESMSGTTVNTLQFVQLDGTVKDSVVNSEYTFDGTNIYITTDTGTVSFNYELKMNIKDNGEVFSSETFAGVSTPSTVIGTSSKTSFWYWGNDDKNKTAAYIDLTGILADYDVYDIPRLSFNDLTLTINYSDNYTTTDDSGNPASGSLNVGFELKFIIAP